MILLSLEYLGQTAIKEEDMSVNQLSTASNESSGHPRTEFVFQSA